MFHHGLLGIEHLMNYDCSFAEEYFKGESSQEGMMTLSSGQVQDTEKIT